MCRLRQGASGFGGQVAEVGSVARNSHHTALNWSRHRHVADCRRCAPNPPDEVISSRGRADWCRSRRAAFELPVQPWEESLWHTVIKLTIQARSPSPLLTRARGASSAPPQRNYEHARGTGRSTLPVDDDTYALTHIRAYLSAPTSACLLWCASLLDGEEWSRLCLCPEPKFVNNVQMRAHTQYLKHLLCPFCMCLITLTNDFVPRSIYYIFYIEMWNYARPYRPTRLHGPKLHSLLTPWNMSVSRFL
jgi:hypothetical protein